MAERATGHIGPGPEPRPDPGRAGGAWLIGLTSLCSDTGHEIVTSVLPAFLTVTLGGSAALLGTIDGISDAVMGAAKASSGPLADLPARRGRLAGAGYTLTALTTAAIGLAATVWQVGALRALAWLGRGVRSPARDAMLGSLARSGRYGKVFGIERAGDNLGAVLGPLLAAGLVAWIGIRPTIVVSVFPSLLAVVAILTAARLAPQLRHASPGRSRMRTLLRRPAFMRALVPIALFECGNLATTLLILRAMAVFAHVGVAGAAAAAILVYALHNAVAAAVSFAAGAWADRSGGRLVLGVAAACYVASYALLALPGLAVGGLAGAFILAGIGIGLGETAESVLLARALPDRLRGSGFGLVGAVQSGGDIVATLVAGVLYTLAGASVAFAYAGVWMLLAVAACAALASRARSLPGVERL